MHTSTGAARASSDRKVGGWAFGSMRLPHGAWEEKLTAPAFPPPLTGAIFCRGPNSLLRISSPTNHESRRINAKQTEIGPTNWIELAENQTHSIFGSRRSARRPRNFSERSSGAPLAGRAVGKQQAVNHPAAHPERPQFRHNHAPCCEALRATSGRGVGGLFGGSHKTNNWCGRILTVVDFIIPYV